MQGGRKGLLFCFGSDFLLGFFGFVEFDFGFDLFLKHSRYSNIWCGHGPFTQERHGPCWIVMGISLQMGTKKFAVD